MILTGGFSERGAWSDRTGSHHVAEGDNRGQTQHTFIPLTRSLALGHRRSSRRRQVSDDAGLGDVLVSGFVQQRVCLHAVPAPVDQPQACAHHNQHFVVSPEVLQAHD